MARCGLMRYVLGTTSAGVFLVFDLAQLEIVPQTIPKFFSAHLLVSGCTFVHLSHHVK